MSKRSCVVVLPLVCFFALSVLSFDVPEAAAQKLERTVIKIGVAGALKRPYGIASVRGAEMAAKEINDAGGTLGAKIQIVSADTEATAPKATEAIEKLYYTDKVDTVVGAYSSEEATAFQEQSAKLKMNIIFHGTTSIMDEKYKANPEKYKYYWNYTGSENDVIEHGVINQLPLFVAVLKKNLGLAKVNVGVLTDVALWTEKIHGGFIEGIKANPNCALVYTGKIARDAVDFTAELTEMRSKKVHLILVAMGYSAGYPLIKQAYDVKLPAMTCGLNTLSLSIPDFIKAVGVQAASYNSTMSLFSMPTTPHTAEQLKKYDKTYGGMPHMDVGATYNGVKAYLKAVQTAQSLNHDKVQKALEKVRLPENQSWSCKEFWFTDTHRLRVSQKDGMILSTYQFTPAGDVKILEPSYAKTGDVMIPPWMVKEWKK